MQQSSQTSNRYQAAIELIDIANSEDPNTEFVTATRKNYPREVLYSHRMTSALDHVSSNSSVPLRLATHAQHIQRWKIPRDSYPEGRQGYRRWRTALGKFHAETTAKILLTVGYDNEVITRVEQLLRKERLKMDPECQILEDVVCVVFIEHYLEDFATKHDEEKILDILRKTWRKMSSQGHTVALKIKLPEPLAALIIKALD